MGKSAGGILTLSDFFTLDPLDLGRLEESRPDSGGVTGWRIFLKIQQNSPTRFSLC